LRNRRGWHVGSGYFSSNTILQKLGSGSGTKVNQPLSGHQLNLLRRVLGSEVRNFLEAWNAWASHFVVL
jgi:hypothetical protein